MSTEIILADYCNFTDVQRNEFLKTLQFPLTFGSSSFNDLASLKSHLEKLCLEREQQQKEKRESILNKLKEDQSK